MNTRYWVDHLREAFAAVAAGARYVPLGDNGAARHSLAVELAELRLNARLGRVNPGSPPTGASPAQEPERAAH